MVAPSEPRPTLIYDGHCGFCRRFVDRWREATGDRVEYLATTDPEVAERFPLLDPSLPRGAVQLVRPDGYRFDGADAIFRAIDHQPGGSRLHRAYLRFPAFAWICDLVYRAVAASRNWLGPIFRVFVGRDLRRPRYQLVRWIYFRLFGLVALIAFLSFWSQLDGLVSTRGIAPAKERLERLDRMVDRRLEAREGKLLVVIPERMTAKKLLFGREDGGHVYEDRYRLSAYSYYRLEQTDDTLHMLCALGVVACLMLIVNLLPGYALLLLLLCYLSLIGVSSPWMGYQWDALLIEAGLVSLFFVPWGVWPRLNSGQRAASRAGIWLIRLLVLKLMFLSAVVKLYADSPPWEIRTALNFHYWTQPLPFWGSWYAHHLPDWVHEAGVVAMFVIEGIVPFLMFGSRRMRYLCFSLLVFLQVGILATGNYGFFNLLTLTLCLTLLDDGFFQRALHRRPDGGFWDRNVRPLYAWLIPLGARIVPARESLLPRPPRIWTRPVAGLLALLIAWLSYARTMQTVERNLEREQRRARARRLAKQEKKPTKTDRLLRQLRPLRLINSYGLFARMTIERPEILVEGSYDGISWKAYRFKYKPGDPDRAPRFAWFHMPRLDWQMWFAALQGSCRNWRARWYLTFLQRLLEGEKRVLALLGNNPFPQKPPRYIRSTLWDYTFSHFEPSVRKRRREGRWWRRRKRRRVFCPTVMLNKGRLVGVKL